MLDIFTDNVNMYFMNKTAKKSDSEKSAVTTVLRWTHDMLYGDNEKLSQNYYQMLLLKKSSEFHHKSFYD